MVTYSDWKSAMRLQQQLEEAQRHPPKDLGKCQVCTRSGMHTHKFPVETVPVYINGQQVGTIPADKKHDSEYVNRRLDEFSMQAALPSYLPKSLESHDVARNYMGAILAPYDTNYTHTSWPSDRYTCPDCDDDMINKHDRIALHKEVCPKMPPMTLCEICSQPVKVKELKQYTPLEKEYMLLVCTTCQTQMTKGIVKGPWIQWKCDKLRDPKWQVMGICASLAGAWGFFLWFIR